MSAEIVVPPALGVMSLLAVAEITTATGVPLGWVIACVLFVGGGMWAVAAVWFPLRGELKTLRHWLRGHERRIKRLEKEPDDEEDQDDEA